MHVFVLFRVYDYEYSFMGVYGSEHRAQLEAQDSVFWKDTDGECEWFRQDNELVASYYGDPIYSIIEWEVVE
jgi:hypothetical protein